MHRAEKIIRKIFDVRPGDVPPYTGWAHSTRETLYDIFKELGLIIGAEVGIHRGENARTMCDRIPGLHLTCVDPKQRGEAVDRLHRFDVKWLVLPSGEAARHVTDGSLDFIYVDALHDFDNVIQDLIHWVPKVRVGGIVAGHDYYFSQTCHVPMAVDAYTRAHSVFDWYLTTDNRAKSGKYPYSPSFFWVRQG